MVENGYEYLYRAESTSSNLYNERLLTGNPTFKFSLVTSAHDPERTVTYRLIINKRLPFYAGFDEFHY